MNKTLLKLLENWKANGSPKQEGFNWTSSRNNWLEAFPEESRFISTLAIEIDRDVVRNICNSEKYNISQKFLTVMIWGYGDRGYGPYRVRQMMNQDHTVSILSQVYQLSQEGNVKDAYEFLSKNRIRVLGPSYGSKFLTFITPREVGAPIYDSLVAMWVNEFAKKEFTGVPTSSLNWNLKTYSRYRDWVKDHSAAVDCYPDEIELVLFRDAESKFSKDSKWSGK